MQPELPAPYDLMGSSNGSPAPLDAVQLNAAVPPDFLNYLMQQPRGAAANGADAAIRGTWTKQEDDFLVQAVSHLGPTKWNDIAKFVPSRTAKQCRERWYNHLSPTLKKDPFEAWEDQLIMEKQRLLGNRWSLIAQSLPGRSAGAVKNRWYAGLNIAQRLPHASIVGGYPGQPL
jgi:hypothetical protein